MSGAARIERGSAGRWARIAPLTTAGLIHGFSCRDLPRPAEALADGLGVAHLPRTFLEQRHTARVHRVAAGSGAPEQVGDALVTSDPGVVLGISTADCLPLVVLDPRRGAVAAVHAGWRGTLAGVLAAALQRMGTELDTRPADLWVGAGPGIRACCFEVGREVEEAFATRWEGAAAWMRPGAGERPHLDLLAANRHQAAAAGVPPERFLDGGWCTHCRDDLFHSYRREGPGGGRIITLATLPANAGSASPSPAARSGLS